MLGKSERGGEEKLKLGELLTLISVLSIPFTFINICTLELNIASVHVREEDRTF